MYAIADVDYEQISSPARYVFVYDPNFFTSRIGEDGAFEAEIKDLILFSSEQTMISAGLETLEDLVSKISEEMRMRGLPKGSKFDAAVHETKYEEFQRRYKTQ